MSGMSEVAYIFPKRVKDKHQLRDFMASNGSPWFADVIVDDSNDQIILLSNEANYSEVTKARLQVILDTYPDTFGGGGEPPGRPSGYIPYELSSAEPDTVLTTNTSLTRNMLYSNLTINPGVTLNTNGWRIIVSRTLVLNGIVAFNGAHATTSGPGINPVQPYTTFLGPGLNGVAGISQSGAGRTGLTSNYINCGGLGASGGSATFYQGGKPGAYSEIGAVDGSISSLGMMPQSINGRTVSGQYLIGGASSGSGALYKGNTNATSGSSGASGGVIVVAVSSIIGNGRLEAKGGNGSSGSHTSGSIGSIGGGASGAGGCVIVITQSQIPPTLTIDVSPGIPGKGLLAGADGQTASEGNVFKVFV